MLLLPPALPAHACVLKLLHLRHALALHLAILPRQPEAQHDAEHRHHQAHGRRDPHAFAVERRFVFGEDIRACQRGFGQSSDFTFEMASPLPSHSPRSGPHCPTVAKTVYPPARFDSVAWIFATQASSSATEAKISTDRKMLK